jgi:hypothetical protein
MEIPMNKLNQLLPALLVVATLGACGGGGGSSTPTPAPNPAAPLVITSANMQDVASNAYSSTDLLAFQQIALAAGVVTSTNTKFSIKNFVAAQVQQILQDGFAAQNVAGAVVTTSKACVSGGTVTTSENDADGSLTPTAGDSVKLFFTNCLTAPGAPTINGEMLTTFTKISGSGQPGTDVAVAFNVLSTNLSFTTPTVGSLMTNGTMSLDVLTSPANSKITTAFAMPSFTLSLGAKSINFSNYLNNKIVNTTTGAFTSSMQGVITDTELGGLVTLTTVSPFQGVIAANANPSTGKLKLAGSNSTLFITALDSTYVNLELDNNNDGVIDVTKKLLWGDL